MLKDGKPFLKCIYLFILSLNKVKINSSASQQGLHCVLPHSVTCQKIFSNYLSGFDDPFRARNFSALTDLRVSGGSGNQQMTTWKESFIFHA